MWILACEAVGVMVSCFEAVAVEHYRIARPPLGRDDLPRAVERRSVAARSRGMGGPPRRQAPF